jgi:hypothetical protein
VGEERIKITVDVNVGDGVSVFRGVGVRVAVSVDVGSTAAVWDAAAFAVCTINVLTAFGSAVGKGVASDGAHATTSATIMNQNRNFTVRLDIFALPHPKWIGI